ncbi:beta-porphyranase D [Bacteroidota bacterium]
MKKMRTSIFIVFLTAIAAGVTAQPPLPESGKRWVLNPEYSDEFNGTELDTSKWYDYHPTWKGRPPGLFMRSQVKVANGYMTIRGEKMDKDTIVHRQTFNIKGGAVISKKRTAWFGYYECRFKAAKTSMSTTFWFSTRENYPGPKDCDDGYSLEWDVQECIGRRGDFDGSWFASGMHSNAHYWYNDCNKKRHDYRSPEVRFETSELASENFNIYGGWWKDESTATYYFNNGEGKSQHFYDEIKNKPFDRPMGMNLVSETYPFPWIELPNDEELADPEKNICYYDWVRAYKLVDVDEANIEERLGDNVVLEKDLMLYKENVNLDKELKIMPASKILEIPFTYMANEDRDIHFELRNPANVLIKEATFRAYAGYGNVLFNFALDSAPIAENGYMVIADIRPVNSSVQDKIMTDKIHIDISSSTSDTSSGKSRKSQEL